MAQEPELQGELNSVSVESIVPGMEQDRRSEQDGLRVAMNSKNSIQVGVRLESQTVAKIDKMVEEGKAMNRADAVRIIVRKGTEEESE